MHWWYMKLFRMCSLVPDVAKYEKMVRKLVSASMYGSKHR